MHIVTGCAFYFCYGIDHSLAKNDTNSHRGDISFGNNINNRRERPNSLMLSPVPISSIPTDLSNSGATANFTPTFDLTTLDKSEER